MKRKDIVFSFFGFFTDDVSPAGRQLLIENRIVYQKSFLKLNGTDEYTGSPEAILSKIPNVADYDWNDLSTYSNTNPDVYLERELKEAYFQIIVDCLFSNLKQNETATTRIKQLTRETLLKINDPKIDNNFIDVLINSNPGTMPYLFIVKLNAFYIDMLDQYQKNITYFYQGSTSIDDLIEDNQIAIDSSSNEKIDISAPVNIKVKTVKTPSSFAWGEYGIIEWTRENVNDNNSPFLTDVTQGTVIATIKNPEDFNQKINISVSFSGTIIERLKCHGSYVFVDDDIYTIGENDRFNAPVFDQNARYVWQNFMFIQILINIKTAVENLSTDTETYSIDVNIDTSDDPIKEIIERYVLFNIDQDTLKDIDVSDTSNNEDVNTNYSLEQATIDIIKLIMINGTNTAYPDDLSAKNSSIYDDVYRFLSPIRNMWTNDNVLDAYDDIENVFLKEYNTNIPTGNVDAIKKIIDFTAKQIYGLTSDKIGTVDEYDHIVIDNPNVQYTQDFDFGYFYGNDRTKWMDVPIDRICQLAGHDDADVNVKTEIYKILLVVIYRDQRSVENYYNVIQGQSLPASTILLENRKYTPYDVLQNTLVS